MLWFLVTLHPIFPWRPFLELWSSRKFKTLKNHLKTSVEEADSKAPAPNSTCKARVWFCGHRLSGRWVKKGQKVPDRSRDGTMEDVVKDRSENQAKANEWISHSLKLPTHLPTRALQGQSFFCSPRSTVVSTLGFAFSTAVSILILPARTLLMPGKHVTN